jgi:aminoglycoside phosphotransferase (APT) family kinase protein
VTAEDALAFPRAFSGQRLDWRDLPRHVRTRIAELAGTQVTAEIGATTGFSPGFAAVLELADGSQAFVKAVSAEQNPESPDLARREIQVAGALPPGVPAPKLLWSHDDGEWVVVGFDVVHGRAPEQPWRPEELTQVLDALTLIADAQPQPSPALPRYDEAMAATFSGWRSILRTASAAQIAAAIEGDELSAWAVGHLDQLAVWEQDGLRAIAGDALVHGDLRADNIILDGALTWFIDWPHAALGAPWADLAFMLPSVAMQGGGDPQTIFWSHPVSDGVTPHDLRAGLAGLAGYFAASSYQPAPIGIPNLRAFQRAQAATALEWLRDLS